MKAIFNWAEKIIAKIIGEKKATNFMQFIKFGIVGASNTIISTATYLLIVCLGGHYLVGNFFGFVIGTLNSFYWNNKYVFKDDSNSRNVVLTFLKTLCTYAGVGLVLNSFLLFIWIDVIGISKVIAQFVNLAVTIPLNFVINKFWAFRNKKNSVTVKKEEMGKS